MEYVVIGYRGARFPIPIKVKKSSVIEDKSEAIPRIKKIYDVFSRDLELKRKDELLEKIISNTFLLDGNDSDTQSVLNGREGVYWKGIGKTYLDVNYIGTPALVEHEIIHLMGDMKISNKPFSKKLVKHHVVAANIVITLLDVEDSLGQQSLGVAIDKDFDKLKRYKILPIIFQERIKDFRDTCLRIGNYARESGKGFDILYELSN